MVRDVFPEPAVEHEGKHILMYTSVLEKDLEDGTHMVRQTQSIAIGDGENYEKVAENPVITADCCRKEAPRWIFVIRRSGKKTDASMH